MLCPLILSKLILKRTYFGLKYLRNDRRQLSEAQKQLADSKRQAEESTSRAAGVQGLTTELASLKVSSHWIL